MVWFIFYKKMSYNLKKDLLKQWYKSKNIEITFISNSDDFINNIVDFTNKDNTWEIVYIWHNKWWLSRNINDKEILKLPKLNNSKITLSLLSCKTVQGNNRPTYSNQIAQKLSNQLNINVKWSSDYVKSVNNNYFIKKWTWYTVYPWWEIYEDSIFKYIIPQAY